MFDALLLYQWQTPQPELYRNVEGVIETFVKLVLPLLCDDSLQKRLTAVIKDRRNHADAHVKRTLPLTCQSATI